MYRVPAPKTSVVFWRCAEISQVISTNYADSYRWLQRSFVLTHRAILTRQKHYAKKKTVVAMMELVQKLSQTSPDSAKKQFANLLAQSRAGKRWDCYTCCGSSSPEEPPRRASHCCALSNPGSLREDMKLLFSPLFP